MTPVPGCGSGRVVAAIGLIGALTRAVVVRRTKSMELVYVKKAEAYREYLENSSVLAHAADTNACYPDYLKAYHAARLVASPSVEASLTDAQGLNAAIQRLRSGNPKDYERRESIRTEEIHPAMERAIEAMNADLRKLGR